jgi:hypothetical protein
MLRLTLPLTHDQVFFVCYTELLVKVFFVCYSQLVTRYFLYVTLDMPLTPLHLTGEPFPLPLLFQLSPF